MSAAKSRAVSPTAAKRAAAQRATARKAKAEEEAAMVREAEALLAKINRGLDEAHARMDRLLARYE
jgi:hypothetical protein